MQNPSQPRKPVGNPLPDGWRRRFLAEVDLRSSFTELEDCDHFVADTMRGYIRSLELRFNSAWSYFDRAYAKAATAAESIPNLVHQFLLNIYCFDNALIEAPLNTAGANLPDLWVPTEIPQHVLHEYPEVRLVIQLRRNSEGILRLHLGDFCAAAEIFEQLIGENSLQPTVSGRGNLNALMMNYLGLAATQINLGMADEAFVNLENAAFAVQSGGERINQARAATILKAFYTFLERPTEAMDWELYLTRLPCPPDTVAVFLERARIIQERCSLQSSLVLL
jgi:tetratricopeptide (TPR) repeat protein